MLKIADDRYALMARCISGAVAAASLSIAVWILIREAPLYSSSSDIGWHWLLATHYGSRPVGGPHAAEVLDVMGTYPPLAHLLAAQGRLIFGSELRAMSMLASLAVLSVYIFCFWGLIRFRGLVLAGVFLIANLAAARWRSAIGHEIIDNYFFPQLIATASALFALWGVASIKNTRHAFAAAWIATAALTFIFPATAIVFAAAYGMRDLLGRKPSLSRLAMVGLRASLLILAILANPYFWPMIKNAQYEGANTVVLSSSVIAIIAVAVTATAFAGGRALLRRPAGLQAIGFLAAGYALTALTQFAAAQLGFGGVYAISKYAFGLCTFSIALIAILVPLRPRQIAIPIALPAAVLATLSMIGVELRPYQSFDLSQIEEIDGAATKLASAGPSHGFLHETAVRLPALPAGLNFAVAKVSLQSRWAVGYDTLHINGALEQRSPAPARYLLVPSDDAGNCVVAQSTELALIRRECAD